MWNRHHDITRMACSYNWQAAQRNWQAAQRTLSWTALSLSVYTYVEAAANPIQMLSLTSISVMVTLLTDCWQQPVSRPCQFTMPQQKCD